MKRVIPGTYASTTERVPDQVEKQARAEELLRDQWQVSPRVTLSFGARYEYFPIPTRGGDRGLERYNLETNRMEIGGLGGVPTDLGISMQKNLFAPRLGATFRLTDGNGTRAFGARASKEITLRLEPATI